MNIQGELYGHHISTSDALVNGDHVQRRLLESALAPEHSERLGCLVRRREHGAEGLDDPRLLVRDLGQRVAQQRLVVVPYSAQRAVNDHAGIGLHERQL